MKRIFQLCQQIGYFTSGEFDIRSKEGEEGLRETVTLTIGWHYKYPSRVTCEACHRRERVRIFPGIVGRQHGTLRDFADVGDTVVARVGIAEELARRFKGIESKTVIIFDPTRPEKGLGGVDLAHRWPELTEYDRKKHRGEPPAEIWFPTFVRVAQTPSTYERLNACPACGEFFPRLTHIEQMPAEHRIGDEWIMGPHRPREPGKGLLVPAEMVGDADAFATDSSARFVVREAVRDFVVEMKWRNIKFLEVGEILD